MMKIDTIGSGSSGNGYIMDVGETKILIEAGMKQKELLTALNFNIVDVGFGLISHCHNDHAGYIKQYLKYGFPIFASEEVTADILEIYGAKVRPLKRMKSAKIGNVAIIPFKVPHNETECDGFLIGCPDGQKILFMTDLEMCTYDLSRQNVNHLIVECNYSEKYVNIDAPNKDHVFRGHMELETCKRFIRSIMGSLKSIGLIHLSNDHADSEEFKSEIETEFPGVFVWVAKKGTTVRLPEGR